MRAPTRGSTGVGVLALGYTLDLWKGPADALGDPLQGLAGCNESLSFLAIVAHSPHHRNLAPIQLAHNFWAYPTNAYTPIDSWFRMFRIGLRIAKTAPIDLVEAREPLFNGSIGYPLSRWLRTPLSVCVYGTNPFDPYWVSASRFNRLGAPLARRILRAADGIQVDGSATARSLSAAGIRERRIAFKPVIPNMSDFLAAERDPELRARLSDGGRFGPLLLAVGRVEPQKNVAFLLEVASRLAADCPGVRFVVVGDGWQRPTLERDARARGLSERFVWEGAQPHRQIAKYMATCDAFVLGSRYEGFAYVLIEAAMSGLPIVTTAVSGADDGVVDGRTGWIVPVADADAFVAALRKLIGNPGRAAEMGRQARAHIQSLVARYSDARLQARMWEDIVSRSRSQPHRE